MGFRKRRRAALKGAAKKAVKKFNDVPWKKERTTSVSSNDEENKDQVAGAESVPLYAKNAAYALKIPCGINFLNIEESEKWEPDLQSEESNTDPLSVGEDIIKQEPHIKEEVEIPQELPSDVYVKMEADSLKMEADSSCKVEEAVPESNVSSERSNVNMPYSTPVYCSRSMDYETFMKQFSNKPGGSTSQILCQQLREFGQHSIFKMSTPPPEELLRCDICSATFYHKRTIAAHLRNHMKQTLDEKMRTHKEQTSDEKNPS